MGRKFNRITYGIMVLILLLNMIAPSVSFAAADSEEPVIEEVKVSPKEVGVGDELNVSAKVTDADSGVKNVSIFFDSPVKNSSIVIYLEQNKETGLWEGSHILDSYTHDGEWKFSHLWATDYNGNTATLDTRNAPNLNELNFIVKSELNVNQSEYPYYVTITDETWGNKSIDKDVYIGPDSTIEMEGNVEITGDVYVYGNVRLSGDLTIKGTLHAHQVTEDELGMFNSGTVVFMDNYTEDIETINESTEPYDIPFEIFTENLTNETETIEMEGKTLPFVEVNVLDDNVSLDYRGFFATTVENVSSNKIPFEVVDAFGNTMEKNVEIKDVIAPDAPLVEQVADSATEITGTAEANSTVKAIVSDKEIGTATATEEGNFTIEMKKQPAGTEVSVLAIDEAGNESEATTVTVMDKTAPEAPAVNQLTDQSTKITGTAEPESVVVATVNDQQIGRVTAGTDGTFEMPIKKQAADTKVTITAKDEAGNESKAATIIVKKQVERISGYMRYDTAVEASKQGWDKSETVIIARGDDFADALAGVPLAHKLDAPILMTPSNELWDNSLKEIKRLGAKNAIILGGEGAVSKAVSTELTKAGLKVERIEGSSRFETAARIAKEVAPNGTNQVVVANGMDFPDALSVASYAAKEGLPILLTLDDRVAKATESAVKSLDVKETLVVGGEAVVSKKVQQALPKAERLSGKDRYETNIAIAKHFGLDSKHIYVATGQNYADALTGGVLAAKENSAILLVHHSVPASVTDYMNQHKFQTLSIFGGTGAVDESIENNLTNLLK